MIYKNNHNIILTKTFRLWKSNTPIEAKRGKYNFIRNGLYKKQP